MTGVTVADVIVVGGGLVGAAVGYGLVRRGLRVVMLDEGDRAFRAARANFGLITVQGKGVENLAYHRWTRQSADTWGALASELDARCGINVGHQHRGAVTPCLDERALDELEGQMEGLRLASGNLGFEYRRLNCSELARLIPAIGPEVAGGIYTAYDGQCSPLMLLRALHAGFVNRGGGMWPAPSSRPLTGPTAPTPFAGRTAPPADASWYSPPASAIAIWRHWSA